MCCTAPLGSLSQVCESLCDICAVVFCQQREMIKLMIDEIKFNAPQLVHFPLLQRSSHVITVRSGNSCC